MRRNEMPACVLNDAGWCSTARHTPSPNFDARPEDAKISLLVIHNISLPPGQFDGTYVEDFFCNRLDYDADPYFAHLRDVRVSAHFFIRRDGSLLQFVSTRDRAWHAGVSSFDGQQRCNDFSIGVEMEGSDVTPFSDLQYQTLTTLTWALQVQHPLTDIAGHAYIAPGRKTDPGPFFDWYRYQQALIRQVPLALTNATLRFPALR